MRSDSILTKTDNLRKNRNGMGMAHTVFLKVIQMIGMEDEYEK